MRVSAVGRATAPHCFSREERNLMNNHPKHLLIGVAALAAMTAIAPQAHAVGLVTCIMGQMADVLTQVNNMAAQGRGQSITPPANPCIGTQSASTTSGSGSSGGGGSSSSDPPPSSSGNQPSLWDSIVNKVASGLSSTQIDNAITAAQNYIKSLSS